MSEIKKHAAQKELASAFTQSLFTFLIHPHSLLYCVPANFQNPHGCTVSDISYMLHTHCWTQFKRSAVLDRGKEHALTLHLAVVQSQKPTD